MNQSAFESADPILDEMSGKIVELLDSDQFSALRSALARLSEAVGFYYSVNLNIAVELFDQKRPHPPSAPDNRSFNVRRKTAL
jgi:hypothetical protein